MAPLAASFSHLPVHCPPQEWHFVSSETDLVEIPVLPISTNIFIVGFEAERSGITNKNTSRAGGDLAESTYAVTVRDIVDRVPWEHEDRGRLDSL